ncbi:MAG: DUF4670 domain-containing protein [Spirochaetaceae bacterium]|nr:DUF4670 domain-containing protein [Spirochaetaceae bacterium]
MKVVVKLSDVGKTATEDTEMYRKIFLMFAALLISTLFSSCSFFEAVGHGIAALFFFALKTVLFLGGGVGCAYFIVTYCENEEENKKRKNKAGDADHLILGFLCYLAGLLGFCLYFASPPAWVLIAGSLGGLLFFSCPHAAKRPVFVWLATLPVFAVAIFFAASLTGLWDTGIDAGPLPFAIPVNFWTVLIAGALLAGIPAKIAGGKQRALEKIEEEKKRQEEAEKEQARLAEEERWNNLPLPAKIAEIDGQSHKKQKENEKAMADAKKQLSEAKSNIGTGDPEKILWEYIRGAGSSLSFQWRDFVSGSGVEEAQIYVSGVQDVARFFAARYCVAASEARREDERLTVNRTKAVAYAGHLRDIWDQLTAKQKKRTINSAADSLKIGAVNVKIPDTLKSIDRLAVTYKDGATEKLLGALGSYGNFRKQVNLGSETANVGVFLGTVIGTGLLNNFNANQDLKKKLSKKIMSLYKKIEKIRAAEPGVKAFTERAHEINMALEKAMQAYAKIFDDVYQLLYPANDGEKSKEARERRKASGGEYFSAEESDAVL